MDEVGGRAKGGGALSAKRANGAWTGGEQYRRGDSEHQQGGRLGRRHGAPVARGSGGSGATSRRRERIMAACTGLALEGLRLAWRRPGGPHGQEAREPEDYRGDRRAAGGGGEAGGSAGNAGRHRHGRHRGSPRTIGSGRIQSQTWTSFPPPRVRCVAPCRARGSSDHKPASIGKGEMAVVRTTTP